MRAVAPEHLGGGPVAVLEVDVRAPAVPELLVERETSDRRVLAAVVSEAVHEDDAVEREPGHRVEGLLADGVPIADAPNVVRQRHVEGREALDREGRQDRDEVGVPTPMCVVVVLDDREQRVLELVLVVPVHIQLTLVAPDDRDVAAVLADEARGGRQSDQAPRLRGLRRRSTETFAQRGTGREHGGVAGVVSHRSKAQRHRRGLLEVRVFFIGRGRLADGPQEPGQTTDDERGPACKGQREPPQRRRAFRDGRATLAGSVPRFLHGAGADGGTSRCAVRRATPDPTVKTRCTGR